jgi:hypothetical protein
VLNREERSNKRRPAIFGSERQSGTQVGRTGFVLQLPDGERIKADERFFLIKSKDASLSEKDGLPRKWKS